MLCKIAFQTISESEHRVLNQEEVEEEAVLWANLKRNLANKALVCLHKLSIDVTDRYCDGIVRREKPRAVKCSLFPQWAQRFAFAASNM